jgi:hypothetical protein
MEVVEFFRKNNMRGEQNLLHSELEQRVEDFQNFFPTQQIKTMFIVLCNTNECNHC